MHAATFTPGCRAATSRASDPASAASRRPSRSKRSWPMWNGTIAYALVVITSAPASTYSSCTIVTWFGDSISGKADHSGCRNGAPTRCNSRPIPPSKIVIRSMDRR
jgi:hypothetical protein